MLFACLIVVLWSAAVDAEYNLIDATPSCWGLGLCPYGEPGKTNSIHPNSEERTQRIMYNIARIEPTAYIRSKYGKYAYGSYGPTTEYDDAGDCGNEVDLPYYWLSEGNQGARFGEYDCANCNSSGCGHNTCAERCYLFDDDCGFSARCGAFFTDASEDAWASAEGLCGANMCYRDGHCSAIFSDSRKYFAIGFWPLSNGITIEYISNGPEINYALPNGAHFDERMKINSADYDETGNNLVLMAQFWSERNRCVGMWVAYNGTFYEMELTFGDTLSAIFELHFPIPETCQPYYFVANTVNGSTYRLPESEDYMFGTAWTFWSWWDGPSEGYQCTENHYYKASDGTIVANGAPTLSAADIETVDICAGCDDASVLFTNYDSWDPNLSGNIPVSSSDGGSMSGGGIAAIVIILLLVIVCVAVAIWKREFLAEKFNDCKTNQRNTTDNDANATSNVTTSAANNQAIVAVTTEGNTTAKPPPPPGGSKPPPPRPGFRSGPPPPP